MILELTTEALLSIRQSDPDSRPSEPTDADRAAFREWVRLMYGSKAWAVYTSNWDRPYSD
jgi:hypothetical protein